MLKPLPTNTATFRDIISGDFLYVDKTEYIYHVVHRAKGAFFLSRPRRFGKSLLISTLEELFDGKRELFDGLWIAGSDYDWSVHPVIRLDLSLYPSATPEDLKENLKLYLSYVAEKYGVTLRPGPYYAQFGDLIRQLSAATQVVILIDEYDKPLLDHLTNISVAKQMRDVLKGFYTVIKAMDQYIRLSFITGVSKFSRVSIFSELNNLTDLTMRPAFGTALGLTEAEIRHYFADYIAAFAKQEGLSSKAFLDKMRHWYDGFRFAADAENVYNPFSTMQLFDAQRFANYWFESGTPTFLIKLLHQQNYNIEYFDDLQVEELALSTFDIERLAIVPLLFQTGYLTIKSYDPQSSRYELYYPNYEVENAFLIHLLDAFSNFQQGLSVSHLWRLIEALQAHDLNEFFKLLKVFFANIDYDLHLRNEKYYQTIFYLIFMLIGLKIQAEVKTNDGRIDAVVEVEQHIYIFEFKLDKAAQAAVDQLIDKDYAQKYGLRGKAITQIGVNFDSTLGQVTEWNVVAPT